MRRARPGEAKIVARFNDADPEKLLPNPVHDDAGHQARGRRVCAGKPARERQPASAGAAARLNASEAARRSARVAIAGVAEGAQETRLHLFARGQGIAPLEHTGRRRQPDIVHGLNRSPGLARAVQARDFVLQRSYPGLVLVAQTGLNLLGLRVDAFFQFVRQIFLHLGAFVGRGFNRHLGVRADFLGQFRQVRLQERSPHGSFNLLAACRQRTYGLFDGLIMALDSFLAGLVDVGQRALFRLEPSFGVESRGEVRREPVIFRL